MVGEMRATPQRHVYHTSGGGEWNASMIDMSYNSCKHTKQNAAMRRPIMSRLLKR